MTETIDWQGSVGDAWAEEWRRTDRTFAPLNDALVERAMRSRPLAILDIGCGAGATSLALSDALPGAAITGIDLSEPLVAAARQRAGDGGRLHFEIGDAALWRPAAGAFGLLVSRHGIMFFNDAEGAFRHLRSLTAPGGRLLFSCFRARAENEWMRALRPIIERFAPEAAEAPEPAVGPFSLADPARIERVLAAAGYAAPVIEPLDFDFVVGAGQSPVSDATQYFARIGPFARLLAELDQAKRSQALEEVREMAADRLAQDRVAFRAAAWIVACASA